MIFLDLLSLFGNVCIPTRSSLVHTHRSTGKGPFRTPVTDEESRHYTPLCASHDGRSPRVGSEPQVPKNDPQLVHPHWLACVESEVGEVFGLTVTHQIVEEGRGLRYMT